MLKRALHAGLLCFIMPGLTALICVPLMWHWVGGGFSAVHGTVACFLYVMYMDGWLVRAPPLVRTFSFLYKLAGPLLYAKLALLGRGWCELLLFLLVDWWAYSFIRNTSSEREKTGELHLLSDLVLICYPEFLPVKSNTFGFGSLCVAVVMWIASRMALAGQSTATICKRLCCLSCSIARLGLLCHLLQDTQF